MLHQNYDYILYRTDAFAKVDLIFLGTVHFSYYLQEKVFYSKLFVNSDIKLICSSSIYYLN